jgi:hypothetical protein
MTAPSAFVDWTTPALKYEWGYARNYSDYKKRKQHAKKAKMDFYYGTNATQWYGCYGSVTASNVWSVWYGQQGYQQQITTGSASDAVQYFIQMQYGQGASTGQSVTMDNCCYATTVTYPETEEQRIECERRAAEYKAKDDAATKRAEEMLFLLLSDEQRKQYEEHGYFDTMVNDKLYRINKGRAMNVELIEGGVAKFKYCALPKEYMPAPDVMAAQLLMLQTDEKRFLSIANRTVLHAVRTATDEQPCETPLTVTFNAPGAYPVFAVPV